MEIGILKLVIEFFDLNPWTALWIAAFVIWVSWIFVLLVDRAKELELHAPCGWLLKFTAKDESHSTEIREIK